MAQALATSPQLGAHVFPNSFVPATLLTWSRAFASSLHASSHTASNLQSAVACMQRSTFGERSSWLRQRQMQMKAERGRSWSWPLPQGSQEVTGIRRAFVRSRRARSAREPLVVMLRRRHAGEPGRKRRLHLNKWNEKV